MIESNIEFEGGTWLDDQIKEEEDLNTIRKKQSFINKFFSKQNLDI